MGFQQVTDKINVYRLTRANGKESYGVTPIASELDCGMYPASPELVAVLGADPGFQYFDVYVYNTIPLHTGDKLVTETNEYIIHGNPEVFNGPYLSYQHLVTKKVI